jgi:phage tail sheath protein FI
MATAPTYPGVYIEEIPSGVHTITGVATSITAFVGFATRGPVNDPTLVQSFSEFTRVFGGLSAPSTMSYAVNQFFLNGGSQALILRTAHLTGAGTKATKGTVDVGGSGNKKLSLAAANEGAWSGNLLIRIDHETSDKDAGSPTLFNLLIKDTATGVIEVLRNLLPDNSVAALIEQQSNLVRATATPTARPDADATINPGDDPFDPAHTDRYTPMPAGQNGTQTEADLVPATDDGTGMYALARADLFNLLCIPPFLPASNTNAGRVLSSTAKGQATKFCSDHRAVFLVDPHPDWTAPSQITGGGTSLDTYITDISSDDRKNAALYFPYFRAADPEAGGSIADFPPCGAVAGVMARTDGSRGVWKAPAGIDAGLSGVQQLKAKLTDDENGIVNPLGVNCLRTFPVVGNVVWGARTLAGADILASEWKYVPVRRLALYLEESLYRGTQWVVFEPNDEPLWAQIRLNVGAFMQNLFRQGAFQGSSPRDAYFVKCDGETTTQNDRDLGIVNILVGFAPLKPAEFVIIQIQQIAGQVTA